MMNLPIKRTWIFSKSAGKLYFAAATLGYGFFVFMFAISFSRVFFGLMPHGYFAEAFFRFFCWMGAIGMGTIWMAMLFCVVRFDRESLAGALYLIVLVLTGPLGALIYYALRYRRLLKRDLEPSSAAAASL